MKNTLDFLNNYLKSGNKIVVAVSGGPDSMALLDILIKFKDSKNLTLICAHINHNKREASASEAQMVEDYCLKNGVIFEYKKFEHYEAGNFQEVARKMRYDFFAEILKKYNANILMTAHHIDDLSETILMRISRGSILKGYAGFSVITDNDWYTLVRPLIYMTKDELLNYVITNEIPYAIDESNNEDHYTRNRYRHHILKEMKKENPHICSNFLNFSEKLNEACDFIDDLVLTKYKEMYVDNCLNLIKFSYEKPYLQKMIIAKILKEEYVDDIKYLNDKHINIILNCINSYKPNMELTLPKKMRVIKRYDKLIFTTLENEKNNFMLLFDEEVEIDGNIIKEIDNTLEDGNNICRLDIQDITLPLYFRNRHVGDKIELKGTNGSKKLKEIFIEAKIPLEKRDQWPILVDSHDVILWIPGLKKSKYNKQKDEKCDIILKYY